MGTTGRGGRAMVIKWGLLDVVQFISNLHTSTWSPIPHPSVLAGVRIDVLCNWALWRLAQFFRVNNLCSDGEYLCDNYTNYIVECLFTVQSLCLSAAIGLHQIHELEPIVDGWSTSNFISIESQYSWPPHPSSDSPVDKQTTSLFRLNCRSSSEDGRPLFIANRGVITARRSEGL